MRPVACCLCVPCVAICQPNTVPSKFQTTLRGGPSARRWWWVVVAFCLVGLDIGSPQSAQGDLWDGFETAEASWQVAESDCDLQKLAHERTWRVAHHGHASEHLRLLLGPGNKAYLTYDIAPAYVIKELVPSFWLRADRGGVQGFVRVVLPKSQEPRTGKPISMLIPGDVYSGGGDWQQLFISDLPAKVERHARVLRVELAAEIDVREAFIDKLVINAYTEPGAVQLWIDDVQVSGMVTAQDVAVLRPEREVAPASFDEARGYRDGAEAIELDGSVILTQGRPTQIRMIEYRGESYAWLQSLGFNALLLSAPATPTELAEARQLGIWLIMPPGSTNGRIEVRPDHAPVLAWLLGRDLSAAELDATRQLARELRMADNTAARPAITSAFAPLSAYSRTASMLLLEPSALGGSFEMSDYAQWFADRPKLARPGTPMIALLTSQLAPQVGQQLEVLRARRTPQPVLDYEQLRLLTFTAVASGVRGVCFSSHSRLDAQDAATRQRADTLQLINAELKLVEPWMAAATSVAEVEVDDPAVRVSTLHTERARLLVVRRYEPGQQWSLGPAQQQRVSLVIPGTPSSVHAYRLSTLGMEPITHRRVTGGTHVALESAGVCSLVVLTQDPLVLGRMAKDLAALETKQSRLHYDITARKLEQMQTVLGRLPLNAHSQTAQNMQLASSNLERALRLLSANDRRSAERFIAEADAQLAAVQRGQWEAATRAFASPVASPLCTHFDMLPVHYELAERLRGLNWSTNLLAGGEMESLDALVQTGWRHQRDPSVPLESVVELAPQPHRGSSSLHVQTRSTDPETAPAVVETPAVWITSPPLHVAAGKMVRISGFVRTSPEIAGSQDGLLVFDSLGGRVLAERIRGATSWRKFELFRAAPADAQVTLTIALTGIGEAWVDDVEICVLDLPRSPLVEPENNIAPEEIGPPRINAEELPAPTNSARGWWPWLK